MSLLYQIYIFVSQLEGTYKVSCLVGKQEGRVPNPRRAKIVVCSGSCCFDLCPFGFSMSFQRYGNWVSRMIFLGVNAEYFDDSASRQFTHFLLDDSAESSINLMLGIRDDIDFFTKWPHTTPHHTAPHYTTPPEWTPFMLETTMIHVLCHHMDPNAALLQCRNAGCQHQVLAVAMAFSKCSHFRKPSLHREPAVDFNFHVHIMKLLPITKGTYLVQPCVSCPFFVP
jgi:hypothetical protein